MKKFLPLLFVTWILLLNACGKKSACENGLAAPVITSNSPLTAGDTLVLSIPHVENGMYSWFANYQDLPDTNVIQIPAFDTYLDGEYRVQYFTPGCISDLAAIDIAINPVTSPCSYQKNHGEILTYRPSITFTNVYLDTSSDSTHFSLSGTAGPNGDHFSLNFAANMKPQNGVYTLTYSFYPNPGEVHFYLDLSDDYWDVNEGKIYVNTINGKLTATWCNLHCNRDWDGLAGITSGNLTEP